ncbi:MAG: redox-sensing transcriptional repressor Rex [SAR324 cluster bacterium]|uniref:Redox-sensing transcriptional repressor Rex n=1 Tax=SAR324 cluster bacterium TaxID=2024889 RepID=A0A7X9FPX1_9DELT|nr:redox-sensing transcriptional repressor Rex [SAR324 cluster bacterium]
MRQVSARTVGRLSIYRRLLEEAIFRNESYMHSHELARRAGVGAAQVRRDLMASGYTGSPKHGYEIAKLHESLSDFLDGRETQNVALLGVGNLGRALLSYFRGGRSKLVIAASFDNDPQKAGRVFHGCRCYSLDELPRTIDEQNIKLGILTVPAESAQSSADSLVDCGINGILNFAPVPIQVPHGVYVENIDVTMFLERAAFFGRQQSGKK